MLGMTGCPETSVRNYLYSLRNNPKVRSSQLLQRKPKITRGLKVFENMVLRRIFGPKGDEVTGEWRKLHYEEPMISTALQILLD